MVVTKGGKVIINVIFVQRQIVKSGQPLQVVENVKVINGEMILAVLQQMIQILKIQNGTEQVVIIHVQMQMTTRMMLNGA